MEGLNMSKQEEVKLLSIEEKEMISELIKDKKYSEATSFVKGYAEADFTFTDELGNTILHYLVKFCNKDQDNGQVLPLAQILLEKGVSHTSVNKKFKTPLDYANETSNAPLIGLFRGFPIYIE